MVDRNRGNEIDQKMNNLDDQRLREFQEFDNSKAGVQGLVEAGVTKLPRMFHHEQNREGLVQNHSSRSTTTCPFSVPIIDLKGVFPESDHYSARLRAEVVSKMRDASAKFGFFQAINHGIPVEVLDGVIEGMRGFHEMESELRKSFYSRDRKKKVTHMSNHDLYGCHSADWRDTLQCYVAPNFPQLQELPSVCR